MMRATMLGLLMTVGCGGVVEVPEDAAQPTTAKIALEQVGTECLAVFSGGCTCTYTRGSPEKDSCECCKTACRGEVNYGSCGMPIPLD